MDVASGRKICKLCPYSDSSKSATTSNMANHLLSAHSIKKPGSDVNTVSETDQTPANCLESWMLKRSAEEWMTRQVVLDGISCHQLARSEFQAAAFRAMGLKHPKSHTQVANIVSSYISDMKEGFNSISLISSFNATVSKDFSPSGVSMPLKKKLLILLKI
jgi:hypothetical protein